MSTKNSTELLDRVTALASEVTGTTMAPDSDLIALGFDSLDSLELSARIEEDLGIACTMDDLFECSSLSALADRLAGRSTLPGEDSAH